MAMFAVPSAARPHGPDADEAAVAFLHLPPRTRSVAALHAWLDLWSGIGLRENRRNPLTI
jgi:hypothetical protein